MASPTTESYVAATGATVRGGRGTPPQAPDNSKYRFQQDLLFQRAHALSVPATYVNSLGQTIAIPGEDRFFNRTQSGSQNFGSTPGELCISSFWKWANTGGDWLDSALTPQGTVAWVTSPLLAVTGSPGEAVLDVTDVIRHCDAGNKWYALMLQVASGQVNIVGPCNTSGLAKSVLEIVRGGVTETKELWYCASIRTSTSSVDAQDPTVALMSSGKTLLEFPRDGADQSVPVTSATLRLRYASITSSATVKVFVVNPQVPDMSAPIPGIAADYTLDAGIFAHPAVAARMHVTDSTVIGDVVDINRTSGNYTTPWDGVPKPGHKTELQWDPNLWGTPGVGHLSAIADPSPETLQTLLPRVSQTAEGTKLSGRAWRNRPGGDTVRVVTSTELSSRGLPVLAPGLGALEMRYAAAGIKNGQSTSEGFTTGGSLGGGVGDNDLEMYFKPEHIGQVTDGYMRMHVMLGDGWDPDDTSMGWYYFASPVGKWPEEQAVPPVSPTWRVADFSGKFPAGIQQLTNRPVYANSYNFPTRLNTLGVTDTTAKIEVGGGGYSSTSGIYGYQGRFSFGQGFYKENHPGPCCGGASLHVELYDFSRNSLCIPSQAPIGDWESTWKAGPHTGGLGFLYPRKWYCVEMRWKLNSLVLPYAEPAIGTHYLESGFNVDGFLEWWVDGIHAGTSPMFATRSSRMVDWALQIAQGKPFGATDMLRPMSGVPEEAYMGAASAVLQTYYGGRAPCPKDMFVYLNGVIVSNGEYIGPMKGISRANGGIP